MEHGYQCWTLYEVDESDGSYSIICSYDTLADALIAKDVEEEVNPTYSYFIVQMGGAKVDA